MGNKFLYNTIITLALVIVIIIATTQVLLTLPKYSVMINNSLKIENEMIWE